MGGESSLAQTTVQRIWNAFGLQPHRLKTFRPSGDPDLRTRSTTSWTSTCRHPIRWWCSASTKRAGYGRPATRSPCHRCAQAFPSGGPTTTGATGRHRHRLRHKQLSPPDGSPGCGSAEPTRAHGPAPDGTGLHADRTARRPAQRRSTALDRSGIMPAASPDRAYGLPEGPGTTASGPPERRHGIHRMLCAAVRRIPPDAVCTTCQTAPILRTHPFPGQGTDAHSGGYEGASGHPRGGVRRSPLAPGNAVHASRADRLGTGPKCGLSASCAIRAARACPRSLPPASPDGTGLPADRAAPFRATFGRTARRQLRCDSQGRKLQGFHPHGSPKAGTFMRLSPSRSVMRCI